MRTKTETSSRYGFRKWDSTTGGCNPLDVDGSNLALKNFAEAARAYSFNCILFHVGEGYITIYIFADMAKHELMKRANSLSTSQHSSSIANGAGGVNERPKAI